MYPKFKDTLAYEQANILMQPAFIRVIDNIRKELEISDWEGSYKEINQPYHSYLLCLQKQKFSIEINIWEVCFQVCFADNNCPTNELVQVDNNLFDETGNLDWHNLENKTQKIVKSIFKKLP